MLGIAVRLIVIDPYCEVGTLRDQGEWRRVDRDFRLLD